MTFVDCYMALFSYTIIHKNNFDEYNAAGRNPDNFGVDDFDLSNSKRILEKLHDLAESRRFPNSIRHVVDDRDGLCKLEVRNLGIVKQCSHTAVGDNNAGKSDEGKFLQTARYYFTYDEDTDEKVFVDFEVCGKMVNNRFGRPMYCSESYLLLTHPSLMPGADASAFKSAFNRKNIPSVRYGCDFEEDTSEKVLAKWFSNRSKEVHPSVKSRSVEPLTETESPPKVLPRRSRWRSLLHR